MKTIYLIGSLRNPSVPILANEIRKEGFDVFDDWFAAGEIADDSWRDYEKGKGHTFQQALKGYAAKHVFEFDYFHIQRADIGVMVLPAGKSGHLELGWMLGQGKPGFILFEKEDPERFDCMYQFATACCNNLDELKKELQHHR